MSLEIVRRVAEFFALRGLPVYLVGGYLRALLLGQDANDVDLVLDGDALALGRDLAQTMGGSYVLLDDENPTARVVLPDALYVDLCQMRGGSLLADLGLRDFTINAVALDLRQVSSLLARTLVQERSVQRMLDANGHGLDLWGPSWPSELLAALVDPYGGLDDLRAGRIRAVNDAVFQDDPLRLLRAMRFQVELGFAIVPQTEALIRRDAALIARPSAERVRDELGRVVAAPGAADSLRRLDDLGLLSPLLPEFTALKGVSQPTEHFWDVYEHSIQAVAEVESVCRWMMDQETGRSANGQSEISGYLSECFAGGHTRLTMLKFAALFHDIAKPACKFMEPSGRIRFFGHQDQGALQAAAILQRLRFSVKELTAVQTVVFNHMRPAQLAEGALTGRAIYRYFRDTDEEGISTLLFSLADHRATRGPNLVPAEWQHHLDFTWQMMAAYYQEPQRAVAPPRLVTGDDVMAALGIPPGKLVGHILEQIREAQAGGEVHTREEALALARQLVS